MPLQRRVFGADIVKDLSFLVQTDKTNGFECAFRNLIGQASVHVIKIKMLKSILFSAIQKLGPVFEVSEVIRKCQIDIGGTFVRKNSRGTPVGSVYMKDVQLILQSIQSLDGQQLWVFCPGNSWNVDIGFSTNIRFCFVLRGKVINMDFNQ